MADPAPTAESKEVVIWNVNVPVTEAESQTFFGLVPIQRYIPSENMWIKDMWRASILNAMTAHLPYITPTRTHGVLDTLQLLLADEEATAAKNAPPVDQDESTISLTEEEKNEMKERPITPRYTAFTDEQFAMRLGIAKKMCSSLLDGDETMTAEFRAIYEAFPMWGFYTDKETQKRVKRSYGVAIDKDGKSVLHTQCAHLMFDNLTLGGTPTEDLVRVDQWSEEQVRFIEMTANPGVHLDPLGFTIVLDEQTRTM